MKKTIIPIDSIKTLFSVAMGCNKVKSFTMENNGIADDTTTVCITKDYVMVALSECLIEGYSLDCLDVNMNDYDDEYFVVLDNKNKTFSIEKAIKTYGLKGIQIYDIITDNFYILSGTPNYKKIANKFLNDNNIALFIKFQLDECECDKTYDEPDTESIITGVKEKVNNSLLKK